MIGMTTAATTSNRVLIPIIGRDISRVVVADGLLMRMGNFAAIDFNRLKSYHNSKVSLQNRRKTIISRYAG